MKRFRSFRLAVVVAALLVCGVALAEQLVGAGGVYWSQLTTLVANTTACVEASSDASAKCALFPAGVVPGNWKNRNLVVAQASADTVGCWSLEPGATIDTAKMEIGTTERGACFGVPATPASISQRPSWPDLVASGAFTATGICSIPIGGTAAEAWQNGAAGDTVVYAPCALAADCETNHGSSLSAATCVSYATLTGGGSSSETYSRMMANVGAYLLLESTATPTVRTWKDRVLNF